MTDPLKASKISKGGGAPKVPVGSSGANGEAPLPENGPEGEAPPPPGAEEVPPAALSAAGDNFDIDPAPSLPEPVEPKPIPTWRVTALPKGGKVVWDGQSIRFKVGQTVSLQEYSLAQIERFEASGLGLEKLV